MDTAPASAVAHVTILGADVWNVILQNLEPKDMLTLVLLVNKEIRKFFIQKINWSALIKKTYPHYSYIEEIYNDRNSNRFVIRHNYAEYVRMLDERIPFVKFYLLTREEHECRFGMPRYGVCDSPEQLARRFPKYKGKVYMKDIHRDQQPSGRGWRFHKYGPYLGDRNISSIEYLREADGEDGRPLIDVTWTFSRYDTYMACYIFKPLVPPKLAP